MQVQNINSTNFKAQKITRVLSNKTKDVIEIYSLGRKDKDFAERCLNVSIGRKLPEDSHGIYKQEAIKSFRNFFKGILELRKNECSKYLIAIRNNEQIAGIAKYCDAADNWVTKMMCINDTKNSAARKGITYSIMKDALSRGETVVLDKRRFKDKAASFFKSNGFRSPRDEQEYMLMEPGKEIKTKTKKIKDASPSIKIQSINDKTEYDLQKVLDLD